jgi:hypothetical protein
MMRIFLNSCRVFACVLMAGAFLPAQAQDNQFDPKARCSDMLDRDGAFVSVTMAAWLQSYVAAKSGTSEPIAPKDINRLLRKIENACAGFPNMSLIRMAEIMSQTGAAERPQKPEPGSEAEARRLLREFMKPISSRYELTQALRPTRLNIAGIFTSEQDEAFFRYTERLFDNADGIGPKPGQTKLLTFYTTTDRLKYDAKTRAEFPGGYSRVVQYLNDQIPVVRFKFVEPGKTTGMAFDGLFYVQGRWVLVPKPWRALPN